MGHEPLGGSIRQPVLHPSPDLVPVALSEAVERGVILLAAREEVPRPIVAQCKGPSQGLLQHQDQTQCPRQWTTSRVPLPARTHKRLGTFWHERGGREKMRRRGGMGSVSVDRSSEAHTHIISCQQACEWQHVPGRMKPDVRTRLWMVGRISSWMRRW